MDNKVKIALDRVLQQTESYLKCNENLHNYLKHDLMDLKKDISFVTSIYKDISSSHLATQAALPHDQRVSYDIIRYCEIKLCRLDAKELQILSQKYPGLKFNLSDTSSVDKTESSIDARDDDGTNDAFSSDEYDYRMRKRSRMRIQSRQQFKRCEIKNALDFILK